VRKLTVPNLKFMFKNRAHPALKGKVASRPRLSLVKDDSDIPASSGDMEADCVGSTPGPSEPGSSEPDKNTPGPSEPVSESASIFYRGVM
jgi:hypothetical protein